MPPAPSTEFDRYRENFRKHPGEHTTVSFKPSEHHVSHTSPRSNIINNPPTSTSQTQIIGEEPTSQSVAEDCGSVSLPTASVSTNPRSEGSDEPTISLLEPLPCRSDPNRKPVMSSPSENLMHQATPDRDYRFKRERPNDGDHVPQPPPVKRPRHSPNGSIYLRPACQKREHTSVFSWARWMFTAPRQ